MSVRPESRPAGSLAGAGLAKSWLSGIEGELIAVRISIEPRLLEKLLDALAGLEFPINPQIYHSAALVYVYPDGTETVCPTTTVEFPAYVGRLPEIKGALEAWGFDPASLAVKNMLEEIESDCDVEPAPPGAPYRSVIWHRNASRSDDLPQSRKAAQSLT
jgi:hypothetical protein